MKIRKKINQCVNKNKLHTLFSFRGTPERSKNQNKSKKNKRNHQYVKKCLDTKSS